jgi:hypothetical protein
MCLVLLVVKKACDFCVNNYNRFSVSSAADRIHVSLRTCTVYTGEIYEKRPVAAST